MTEWSDGTRRVRCKYFKLTDKPGWCELDAHKVLNNKTLLMEKECVKWFGKLLYCGAFDIDWINFIKYREYIVEEQWK